MATTDPKTGGLIEAVRRAGQAVVALLQNRLQLFSVELQEEKYRAIQAMLWLGVGAAFVFLGLAMGVGAVGVYVYQQWGIAGLVGLTLVLLLVGVAVLVTMWNRLKTSNPPFAETIRELKKDSEWLQRKP